jgi:hypothetical protein
VRNKPKRWLPWRIAPNVEFSTDFERHCIATTVPDEYGNFQAVDPDGFACQYHVTAVIDHPQYAGRPR